MKSNKLYIDIIHDVPFIQFPNLKNTDLVFHGFSTKHGGISKGYFESMNLSMSRGDSVLTVTENFNRFTEAIGVGADTLVFSDQIHESVIRKVTIEDAGKGFNRPSDIVGVDGLVTNEVGVTLTTFYADCVPLFFLDPTHKVIGLSHGGWRGTSKSIGPKTVKFMKDHYGSSPEDILVGIGPSIGQCCYEVSIDVINEFEKNINRAIIDKIARKVDGNHYLLDLWQANAMMLMNCGVLEENIVMTDICTKCQNEDFFSHRVMGNERGSLAALLALK